MPLGFVPRHAGGRPGTENRVFAIGEAGYGQLERDRGDIFVGEIVGLAVSGADWVGVDQIKDLAHVDYETFFALSDEDAAGGGTSWDADVVHEVRGIGRIVRNRFLA